MNAWKYLCLCSVVIALAGLGCAGDKPMGRDLPAGAGDSGGMSGMSGGSAGTDSTSGTGGVSGEGGSAGMEPAGVGSEGGMGGMEMRVFDAGSEPDRNDVMSGELCDRLSTIQCAGEAFCCDNPGRDFAACKAAMQDGCTDEAMLDAIASAEKTGFDPAHTKLAYEEIERMASVCDPQVAIFGASLEGLRGIFKGTLAPGASCTTVNVTRRDEVAKALASCSDPASSACMPGTPLFWTCDPRGGAGSRCFTDVNCIDGLFCDNPTFDIAGSTCMQRKDIGAACELPNECATFFCKDGQCAEATKQAAYCLSE